MSIIPGIETAAPERTETSSGSSGSPKRFAALPSSEAMCSATSASSPSGSSPPPVMYARHASVVIVKPGRDGNAERGHLGEPDSLAAEQLAPAAAGVLVEVVDVAHRRGIFPQAPVGHTPGP